MKASAERGRKLAALLDCDTPVEGVTMGPLRPEMAAIGVPSTVGRGQHGGRGLRADGGLGPLRAGRGGDARSGAGGERAYTSGEREALGGAVTVLGDTTFDVYLNDAAYWRNVPAAVWGYKLGGYQVLKKWLSYRESKVLGRPLLPEEVRHFRDTARRIAAILLEIHFSLTGPYFTPYGVPRQESESCSRSPRWRVTSEEMAMTMGKAHGCSDAEWQARVELAAAYRLTA